MSKSQPARKSKQPTEEKPKPVEDKKVKKTKKPTTKEEKPKHQNVEEVDESEAFKTIQREITGIHNIQTFNMPNGYLPEQTEKKFQKQRGVYLGNKLELMKKPTKTKAEMYKVRRFREIGLGFETPLSAVEANYIDHKCPFTGEIRITGRILSGIVKSTKMTRSIIVRRNYLKYVPKYRRYEKRHTNIPVHCSPCFHVAEGDKVIIGESRPLSKTIRFNVLKVIKSNTKKSFST
jgi:small subunit ribosomal protein S11e